MFSKTFKTAEVMITCDGDVYNVPITFDNVIKMCGAECGLSPIETIRCLMESSVTISYSHPVAIKIQMGTVGEALLAIVSRLKPATRVAVQLILRDELEKSLKSLRCSSYFINSDGLNLSFNNCFSALKWIGTASASSGQDYIRSTTDIKRPISVLIAQLSETTHKSFKLEQSFFGKMVRPFYSGKDQSMFQPDTKQWRR